MDIPEQDCDFFPSSGCTLYMAFCQALPSQSTLCNNDTLGPTSVCVTDGTNGYSLGGENNNPFVDGELHIKNSATCKTNVAI